MTLFRKSANKSELCIKNSQEVIGGASVLANVLSDDLLNGTAKLLELIETVCANFSGNDVINHNKRSLPEQVDM